MQKISFYARIIFADKKAQIVHLFAQSEIEALNVLKRNYRHAIIKLI